MTDLQNLHSVYPEDPSPVCITFLLPSIKLFKSQIYIFKLNTLLIAIIYMYDLITVYALTLYAFK